MKQSALLIAITILLSMCTTKKDSADLIIKNGTVYTVNKQFDIVESMVIDDGKIIFAGSNNEVEDKYHAEKVIDLKGKAVYPGFNDGHCHFYGYGYSLLWANLKEAKSFDEILERVKKHHSKHSANWLLGRGWDQNDWNIKEFPDNKRLNELFPETAVVLTRIDGHALIANNKAIEIAGITVNNISNPDEAIMLRSGEFSGVFLENTADSIKNAIPELTQKENITALLEAQKHCFAAGLTSVTDAGMDKIIIELIDSLHQNGKLNMRINAMLNPTEENFEHFVKDGPINTGKLNVSSIKLYADGALGSRGACMIEAYSDDPDNIGIMVNTEDYYHKICKLAYENNYQVNIHAIGDSANRQILNIYGEYLKEKNDRRWRIEHSQIVHPDDFKLFEKYSIIPSVQATHATSDMYWATDRIGGERIKGAYAYQQLLEQNNWLINGTDFPIEEIYPLYTFYASIARKDLKGHPENGFQMENGLSREDALRSITIWPAKGSFEESLKGSLEVGKVADFVVLEKDIMTIDESEIPHVKVVKTFVDGEMVFDWK